MEPDSKKNTETSALDEEYLALKSVNVLLELNAVTAQYRLARK